MRVVVLGGGFGGLECVSRISELLASDTDVTLIDRGEGFTFGFQKLDVMVGKTDPSSVLHSYADIDKPGVRFVRAVVTSIDPANRRVQTDAGEFDADVLVVALGADVNPGGTPGLTGLGHEFYTPDGAAAARDALNAFDGGRVVVGVASLPVKCAPAPSEAALLVHDVLVRRGLREKSEITAVSPVPVPVPPSPPASKAIVAAFAERGITWIPKCSVQSLDAERHVALLSDGRELPFDLYLGVPRHHAPAVVDAAGLTEDGWIPVDPRTMRTKFAGVYAIGDVTSAGTPKAGVFAEGQGRFVADAIAAEARGETFERSYEATGYCYLQVGQDNLAEVHVTVVPGEGSLSTMNGPSPDLNDRKVEFAASRARRWFS
ncbi:MAG TPA: FAD/NAD(P)-binding oxidoreductase [Actinomycetes bacterium]|nr:FAD/NAD(P)-binding oxidoreductase [Actinomycetes bacterium]